MRKKLLITVLTVVLLIGAAVSFMASDDSRTKDMCHGPAPGGSGTLKWMYIPEREAGAPEWTASDEWVCAVDQTPPTPVPVPEPEVETVEVTPEPTPEAELSTKGTTTESTSTTTRQASTAPKQAPDPPDPTPTATPNPECEGVQHMTFETYAEQGFTYEEWSAYRKGPCFLPAASQ